MIKEIPILFSTPMVQAILAGRKTQTRRIIKSRHESGLFQVSRRKSDGQIISIESLDWDERNCEKNITCPYGQPGDLLWVRESWRGVKQDFGEDRYEYRATEKIDIDTKWKPSIHMPKTAARIWLEVTNVRAERLQDITEHDALQEGMSIRYDKDEDGLVVKDKRNTEAFEELWQSINGTESWEANPWVWVVEFKVLSTTGKP
jgi:uncharacterized protein YqfB (UPF0267 family)